MRVLITGINGFVGGHLAEYLLSESTYDVWGLSRSSTIDLPTLAGEVRLLKADLQSREEIHTALAEAAPEIIFHLAGQPFVPESFRDPAGTLQTNILGALHLFQGVIEHELQSRIVLIGTVEEYGLIRPEDLPVDEATPLRPTSPYGVSKVAQGLLGLQYHRSHKLDVVCLRPFTHIGPRQNERFVTAAFARQIACIERGLQPAVVKVGNLSACRDFTDVRDMVRAYALAAQYGAAGEIYNIGSGRSTEIRAVLDMLIAASSTTVEVIRDEALMRPVDIPQMICDPTHFHSCTGWEPRIPLSQTLGDILDYWRAVVTSGGK
jgi:GDP-4-dehydro-6-deoxy-D-mannose reductase